MKWVLPAFLVVVAVLAELTLGRASHAPDIGLFFGRFHPLVVHLPIGFFLLVALGEAATFHPKLRERVEPALGLLLVVSALAGVAAFLLGQLLALEGGFPAQSLGWHRRLTLVAVVGMSACCIAFDRQRAGAGSSRWPYRGLLFGTLGVLSLGAHFGGTLTRGDGYLSKYAPGPLKPLFGAPEPRPPAQAPIKPAPVNAEPLIYEHVVQPLLDRYCVECHGLEKQKGKLRLDSLAEVMKGGESGAAVVPGDSSKSPLVQRALLPLSDDDHMPPEDKPQAKAEELAILGFWIDRGASPSLKVKDALAPLSTRSLLEHAALGTSKPASVPVAAAPVEPKASADLVAPAAPASAEAGRPAPAGSSARDTRAPASPASDSVPTVTAPAADATPAPATEPAALKVKVLSGPAFLATHCQKCHGPQKQKGKLRVDSLAALVKGGASGTALVPGSPDRSSVVQRLRLPLENDEHMPPKKETQPTAAEVAAFVAWVRAGTNNAPLSRAGADPAAREPAPSDAPAPTSAVPLAGDVASAAPADPAHAIVADTDAADAARASPPVSDAAGASTLAPETASATRSTEELLKALPPRVVLFSDAIQPLFRQRCGKCHIKDSPAGGLGVDQHRQLLEGGFSGPGVVPKARSQSLVLSRLLLPPSDDEHMPPEGEPQLNADEVELVGAWIEQGAPAGGATETEKLSAGAVRALAALGVRPAPEPLAAKSGGCAACSVPGAAGRSSWLEIQVLAVFAAAGILALRRNGRA